MAFCTISDVHLSGGVGPPEKRCMLSESDALCELEYGIGVERGWLNSLFSDTNKLSEMAWTSIDNDIFEHLRMGTMALLPTRDILENLYELYEHNFDENLPAHKRKFFLTALPFGEYTYKILPPVLPQPVALHIQGSIYPPPFEGLPSVRSKLHPCFVFQCAAHYAVELKRTPGVYPIEESTLDDIFKVFIANSGCLPKSWLGPVSTWAQYSRRPAVIFRPDTPVTIAPAPIPLKEKPLGQTNANSSKSKAVLKAGTFKEETWKEDERGVSQEVVTQCTK